MFNDRWKPLTRADPAAAGRVAQLPSSQRIQSSQRGLDPRTGGGALASRHSNGLEQFFGYIQGEKGLNLLDLSGASQANIAFITELGHRLYSEDLLQSLDLAFGDGDFYANQSDPARLDPFLRQCLNFPESSFDGALVWDTLEFLAPPLLKAVVERLGRCLRPRSYLLAMFHADERAQVIPAFSYRISNASALLLAPRGMRSPAQFFNNRSVEKLFQSFESVKFFLSRDALREVIVKR